jgi:sulfatase maturation enzyme AslB (radical SAM superfamily)
MIDICSSRTCYLSEGEFTREINLNYRCNQDCEDCPIPVRNVREISFETAKTRIEEAFHKAILSRFRKLNLILCGGEVLLSDLLLRELLEWITTKDWGLPYRIMIETNGTLINDQFVAWFSEYVEVAAIRLTCRYGWIDRINFELLEGISQHVTPTFLLSAGEINYLSECIIYLHEKGYTAHLRFVDLSKWTGKLYHQYIEQVSRLLQYYKEHLEVRPVNIIDLAALEVLYHQWKLPELECPIPKMHDFADVNGTLYPCRQLSPAYLTSNALAEVNELLANHTLSGRSSSCEGCLFQFVCIRCPATRVPTQLPNPILCKLVKANLIFTCNYCAKLLSTKSVQTKEEELLSRYVLTISKQMKEVDREHGTK